MIKLIGEDPNKNDHQAKLEMSTFVSLGHNIFKWKRCTITSKYNVYQSVKSGVAEMYNIILDVSLYNYVPCQLITIRSTRYLQKVKFEVQVFVLIRDAQV